MQDIISEIREMFLNEAVSSPLLFHDLANMEKYISESYTGRSLIELLQNADDAFASKFLVRLLNDKTYIVANDGRKFTNKDIFALCRSGMSTKKRNGSTIGFRGIGFKSIVNYAEQVHLISGNIKTTFSRELTKNALHSVGAVPMIRIPHKFSGDKYSKIINSLLHGGYNTIFIFEVSNNSLSEEIRNFDNDVLIFLQSVTTVLLQDENLEKYSISKEKLSNIYWDVSIYSNDKKENWLVTIPQPDDKQCSVAFKYDGTHVIEAKKDEAIIHSFMPTHDRLSIPIKINGDFSTDPSRTKIIIDEHSKESVDICTSIIAKLVKAIWSEGGDQYNIIKILEKANISPFGQIRGNDINDVFVLCLKRKLRKLIIDSYNDRLEIYLQPEEILNDDFERISTYLKIHGIGNRNALKIPGIVEFFKMLNFKELSLEKCLDAMKVIECSAITRKNVLVAIINMSRFGMTEEFKTKVKLSKLISFDNGVIPIIDSSDSAVVKSNFEEAVIESLTTSADYISFARTMGINKAQLAMNQKNDLTPVHITSNTIRQTKLKTFSKVKAVKKWRSVEKNVASVLQLMDDVLSVLDVSTQNLGYDIEVTLKNGKRRFYEVKSVDRLGDMFSFSNNEYSTAMQYRKNYFFAIAAQDDFDITICFIQDPVNTLKITKRVTRWEWICNEYTGEVVNTKLE